MASPELEVAFQKWWQWYQTTLGCYGTNQHFNAFQAGYELCEAEAEELEKQLANAARICMEFVKP